VSGFIVKLRETTLVRAGNWLTPAGGATFGLLCVVFLWWGVEIGRSEACDCLPKCGAGRVKLKVHQAYPQNSRKQSWSIWGTAKVLQASDGGRRYQYQTRTSQGVIVRCGKACPAVVFLGESELLQEKESERFS